MNPDTVPNDDLRGMARRAGYDVDGLYFSECPPMSGYYVQYLGPDPARRALRDVGPFDNEADAWARAVGMAREYKNGA